MMSKNEDISYRFNLEKYVYTFVSVPHLLVQNQENRVLYSLLKPPPVVLNND